MNMNFYRRYLSWYRSLRQLNVTSIARPANNVVLAKPDILDCPCGGKPVVPKNEVICPSCNTTIEGGVGVWNRMVERVATLSDCCKVEENLAKLNQTTGPLVRCTQCNRRFYKFGV